MAEPVPDTAQNPDDTKSKSGAADDAAPESTLPRNADDRAAAAALSSLDADATTDSAAGAGGGDADPKGEKGGPSAADREALGKAMNRLEAMAGKKAPPQQQAAKKGEKEKKEAAAAGKLKTAEKSATEEEEAKKKTPPVKVGPEDVNLLVGVPFFSFSLLFFRCIRIILRLLIHDLCVAAGRTTRVEQGQGHGPPQGA